MSTIGFRVIFVKADIMSKQLIQMEELFKALGDTTRLRILGLLLTGEVCVCDIHQSLKIPQSKTSRHLAYLRKSGLVETRRSGLWIHPLSPRPPLRSGVGGDRGCGPRCA